MKSESDQAPYFQTILDYIDGRADWNRKDSEVMRRRLGERKKTVNRPYPNAPNFVETLIDDIVSMKTDQEISMIMNAPSQCVFIPIGQVPAGAATQAQQAFDTYLRHVINYRRKKEQCVDMKNARGFGITVKVYREDDRLGLGTIPDFEVADAKDLIVSPTQKASELDKADCFARVLRYGARELKEKRDKGWKNVDQLIHRLDAEDGDDYSQRGGQASSYDDETQDSLKATQRVIGITASDFDKDRIVVWEVYHYASKWDVKNAPKDSEIKRGRKVISYICPDEPDLLLHVKPWKHADEYRAMDQKELLVEAFTALKEGRNPETEVLVSEGEDMPWPVIQHRNENRTDYWYDSRGLGHILMDNQIMATAMKNAEARWLDYSSNPMLRQGDTAGDVNEQSVQFKPGGVLPRGLDWAVPPQPPPNLAFISDRERRLAASRAGAGSYQLSATMSESRKVEKTKAEIDSQNAQQNIISSASVDRFNDPDRDLFQMLWDDLCALRPALPMLDQGQFMGTMDVSLYDMKFIVVPAASARTLNPDTQFAKNQQLFLFLSSLAQQGVPIDLNGGASYVAYQANPDLARQMLPSKDAVMPINMQIQKMGQTIQQLSGAGAALEKNVQAIGKLAIEHDDRLAEVDDEVTKTQRGFASMGVPLNGGAPRRTRTGAAPSRSS